MGNRLILASNGTEVEKWLRKVHKIQHPTLMDVPQTEHLKSGDHVIVAKTLPWEILANISAACGQLFVLHMNVKRHQRGTSLTAGELRQNRAKLMPLKIEKADIVPTEDVIIVTRHPGAQAWLKARFPHAPVVEHWEKADWQKVRNGTTLVGVFPPEMVEEVNRRGGQFLALQFGNKPDGMKHRELTAEEMETYGAFLQGYTVRRHEEVVCLDCGTDWIVPHSYSCPCCGGIAPYNAKAAHMPFGKT